MAIRRISLPRSGNAGNAFLYYQLHLVVLICVMDSTQLCPYPLQAGLLACTVITVYHWSSADVGFSLFFEQRDWLSCIGIQNQVEFRKREKAGGNILSCQETWSLPSCTAVPGSREGLQLRTTVLSTSMLIAWLFMKFRRFCSGDRPHMRQHCSTCLYAFHVHVEKGFRLMTDRISVTVLGITLMVQSGGTLEFGLLFLVYPQWLEDWDAIFEQDASCCLNRAPADHRVSLMSALSFLESRCYFSGIVDNGHWMVAFRNAILRIMSFMVELSLFNVLDTVTDASKMVVTRVYGATGKHKRHTGILSKKRMLDKVLSTCGSNNVQFDTMADGHKGFSSAIMALRNSRYLEMGREAFRTCSAVALHWDAASYGGLSTNIGFCMNTRTRMTLHMKPVVKGERFKQYHHTGRVVGTAGGENQNQNVVEQGYRARVLVKKDPPTSPAFE